MIIFPQTSTHALNKFLTGSKSLVKAHKEQFKDYTSQIAKGLSSMAVYTLTSSSFTFVAAKENSASFSNLLQRISNVFFQSTKEGGAKLFKQASLGVKGNFHEMGNAGWASALNQASEETTYKSVPTFYYDDKVLTDFSFLSRILNGISNDLNIDIPIEKITSFIQDIIVWGQGRLKKADLPYFANIAFRVATHPYNILFTSRETSKQLLDQIVRGTLEKTSLRSCPKERLAQALAILKTKEYEAVNPKIVAEIENHLGRQIYQSFKEFDAKKLETDPLAYTLNLDANAVCSTNRCKEIYERLKEKATLELNPEISKEKTHLFASWGFKMPIFRELCYRGLIQDVLLYRAPKWIIKKLAPQYLEALDSKIYTGFRIVLTSACFTFLQSQNKLLVDSKYQGVEGYNSLVDAKGVESFVTGVIYGVLKEKWGILSSLSAHILHDLYAANGAILADTPCT